MIPPVPKDLTEKDAKRIRAWGRQPGPPPEGWQCAGQPRSFNHARVALTGVPHAVYAVPGCGTDVYVPPWVYAALDTPTFARRGEVTDTARGIGMLVLWWGAVNEDTLLSLYELGGIDAVTHAVLAECDLASYAAAVKHRYELLGLVTG